MEKIKADHRKISLAVMNCHAFYRCGMELLENSNVTKYSDLMFKAFPAVTNLCLSVEIGLKAMKVRFNEEFEKTHDIYKLFCSLREGLQQGLLVALKMVNKRTDEDNIRSIQKMSNSFVELRYYGLNEKNTLESEIGFVIQFAGIVHNLVLAMNPNTKKEIEQLESEEKALNK